MTPDQIATKADIAALADQMERLADMIAQINPTPERMSLPAAAEYCDVTVETVRGWISTGRLKAEGPSRHRSVATADLERFRRR